MSAIHGVEGLIKWIKGDEWRNDFDAVFDRHVGPACRGAGVEPEELADIIGDHGMTVLWGCAFEDFVSSGSGERNVADEYLKRRGWKESAGARAYIRALRTSRHEPLRSQRRRGRRKLPGARPRARRRAGAGVRALRPPAVFLNGTGLPPGSSPFSARRRSRALRCRSPTPWRKRPLLRLSASGKRRARRRGSSPSRSAGMSTRSTLRP
jgi:hypothetical protein